MDAIRSKKRILRSLIFALLGILNFLLAPIAQTIVLSFPSITYADTSGTCEFPPTDEPDNDGDECYGPTDIQKSLGGNSADTNCDICTVGQKSGDPINNTTGNEFEVENDYIGAGAFPLVLTRYYNSQSILNPSTPDSNHVIGPVSTPGSNPPHRTMGANWTHSYGAYLQQVSDTTVQLVRADQKIITFTPTGTTSPIPLTGHTVSATVWKSDADVNSRLVQAKSPAQPGLLSAPFWLYTTGDDSVETYDMYGKLISVKTRAGLTQTLSYDTAGRLVSVRDPFGRTLGFTYDAQNRITQITDPAGKAYLYSYDASSNLVAVTYPDGNTRHYLYENAGFPYALTGIIDELGNRFATFAYDAKGLAVSSEHAGGADKVTLTYDMVQGTTTVTDALGSTRTYAYQTLFGIAHTINASQPCANCGSDIAHFGYDANGNIIWQQDFLGNTTTSVYDLNRNLETSRTEASGTSAARTITTTWNPNFRLPASITEPSRVTTFSYDAQGNLLQKTITGNGQARTWTYTYNGAGQVLTVDGPRTDAADTTTFTYDTQGNLTTATNALGHATKVTSYDVHGRPLQIQDPNGLVITLGYDVRGRLISRAPGKEITRYTYDAAGNLTKVTGPDDSYFAYSYDAAHRLTSITDSLGNRLVYTLDGLGNHVKEQVFDPSNTLMRTGSRIYNTLDQLSQEIGAAGQITAYVRDGNGNLTKSTDPLGNTTTYERDALNRVTRVTAPDGGGTAMVYNSDDSIAGVTDPRGNETLYSYDGLGNPTAEQSPDRGKITRTFDAAGNVLTSTDGRGLTTTHTYDLLNRLTRQQFSDGTAITFNYDEHATDNAGIGRLTSMVDASGTTTFDHDQRGHVIRKKQTLGGVTLTTTHTYDQQTGHLTTSVLPSGAALDYGYNTQSGLPETITVNDQALIGGIKYEPFSDQVKLWGQGDGSVNLYHLRETDQDGNITKIVFGDTSANDNWGGQRILYSYDKAGRLLCANNNNYQDICNEYDGNSRLTGFKTQVPGITDGVYAYDLNGNRTWSTDALGDRDNHISPFNNQLETVTSGSTTQTLIYDQGGNLTQDGKFAYVTDARGKFSRVSGGGVDVRYAYNGLGERVKKEGSSGATLFVQDGYQMMGEYTATGAPVQETVYLGGLPVGIIKPSGLYYVNPDPIGTPLAITNTAGTLVWSWEHAPFGDTLPNENPKGAGTFSYNLRFPGQYFDSETGAHYNNARTYLPKLGFYQQPDPIGLKGGINPYVYVGGNPLNRIDPKGKESVPFENTVNYDAYSLLSSSSKPGSDYVLKNQYLLNGSAPEFLVQMFEVWVNFVSLVAGFPEIGAASDTAQMCRVGRWMSQYELKYMQRTGRMLESNNGGVSSILIPPNPSGYGAYSANDIYVEFDLLPSSINAQGNGWGKIFGPNSIFGPHLNITEMPTVENITIR